MKIETNVPMPDKKQGRPVKYPFGDMQVGDSIEFKEETIRATRAAYMHGKRHGKKLKCIMTDGVLRIWRTE